MSNDYSGRTLHGSYRLVRKIGEGSMGAVYEAQHTRLPKRFAVKMIAGEAAKKREALARFRREAEITSRLGHPNIIEVVDFNETPEGEPYLVMELLSGRDLASYISAAGPLQLGQIERLMTQITSALDAAHESGVVHRDLKPHNVFLVGDELRAKIVDFGISKIQGESSSLTRDESIIGTPHYMAPEQIAGDATKVDWRADIYAAGAILYEMLCGKPPYFGAPLLSVLYKVVHERPTPLATLRPQLPPGLDALIGRAMAADREARYQHAGELMGDLRQLIARGAATSGPLEPLATEPLMADVAAYPLDELSTAQSGAAPSVTGPRLPARTDAVTLPPGTLDQAVRALPSDETAGTLARATTEPRALTASESLDIADASGGKPISTLSHSSGELRQLVASPPQPRRERSIARVVIGVAVFALLGGAGALLYYGAYDRGSDRGARRGGSAAAVAAAGSATATAAASGSAAERGSGSSGSAASATAGSAGSAGSAAGASASAGSAAGASAHAGSAASVTKRPVTKRPAAKRLVRTHVRHHRRPGHVKFVLQCNGHFWPLARLWVDGKRKNHIRPVTLAAGLHRVKAYAGCREGTLSKTLRVRVAPGAVITRVINLRP